MRDRDPSQIRCNTVRKGSITRSRQISRASPRPAVRPAASSAPETVSLKSAKLGLDFGLLVGALDEVGCHRGAAGVLDASSFLWPLNRRVRGRLWRGPLERDPPATGGRHPQSAHLARRASAPEKRGKARRLGYGSTHGLGLARALGTALLGLPLPSWQKRWGSHCPEPLASSKLPKKRV